MKYFKYCKRRSSSFTIQVWEELNSLKNYAYTIHGEKMQTAMLDSFYHIMRLYQEEKCTSLHNYCISILKNIYAGDKSELAPTEEALQHASSKAAVKKNAEGNDYDLVDVAIMLENEDLRSCIRYLFPRYIQDFKFFVSNNAKFKTYDYNELRDYYTEKTIGKALKVLNDVYSERVQKFLDTTAEYHKYLRSYDSDRYKKSFDTSLEFECILNGVVLYRNKSRSKKQRNIYKVNIRKTIQKLKHMLKGDLNLNLPELDLDIWSSLNGKIYFKGEVDEQLENEIVGKLLAELSYAKVLVYSRGDTLYLSSTKEYPQYIYFNIVNRSFAIELEDSFAKEVQ